MSINGRKAGAIIVKIVSGIWRNMPHSGTTVEADRTAAVIRLGASMK